MIATILMTEIHSSDKPILSVVIERRRGVRLLATFTIKLHTWRGDLARRRHCRCSLRSKFKRQAMTTDI